MANERAVLAGGCFWGMQDLIRKRPGVTATRVGYTGGEVANATYRNHGNHAEAIEILFDNEVVSYRQILELFFRSMILVHRIDKVTILVRPIAQLFIMPLMHNKLKH